MSPNSLNSSDFLQWFVCCVPTPPPNQRRKIDRSMIGNPTDFRHTGHLGTDDLLDKPGHVSLLQAQMSSKDFILPLRTMSDDQSTSSSDFT
ncbi:unnamed protein product [Allacma fusca]|uniref:CRIB domain-containing protein n=1 Tax=Allacma fusca TaxID=39272 RepID=A0A8J2KJ80_9HEXA|nr:unnamed protein product [Allacma fusca]